MYIIRQQSEGFIQKLFKNAYFLIKMNLPLHHFTPLNEFLETYGIELGLHYKGNDVIRDLVDSIGKVIEDEFLEILSKSSYFSILID